MPARDVAAAQATAAVAEGQEGTVDDVVARGLAELFVGRELRAVVAGNDEVMACDPPAGVERLRELYAEEVITGHALHRLGAFV